MSCYWLDTDVLVWAKDNAYRFGTPHGNVFWARIEKSIDEERVKITKRNFDEMVRGRKKEDPLSHWLTLRRDSNFSVSPSKEVQKKAAEISEYAYSNPNFLTRWNNDFARGADPWLIAQAIVDKGVVVTRETNLTPDAKRPKIPNVCRHFGVRFKDMFDMVDALNK